MQALHKLKPVVLWPAILALLFFIGLGIYAHDRILGRATVDGLPMLGWKRARAEAVLRRRALAYAARPIVLDCGGGRIRGFMPADAGLALDWRMPLRQAYAIGRRGWPGARLLDLVQSWLRGREYRLRARVAASVLADFLREKVAPGVEYPPRNAAFTLDGSTIVPSREGRRIDLAATKRNILAYLLAPDKHPIKLVLTGIKPRTSAKDLQQLHLRSVLSSYGTDLAGSPENRKANITLGAARINGILISPQGKFSFNRCTGPRDAAHGYRTAPEIIQQELRPGVGGGICQVATTLYNAVLLADLPVLERVNHSIPPGYVPLGMDATVYYPGLDFVFSNSTGGYLMILADVHGDRLSISLLGEEPLRTRVTLIGMILARIEPPLVPEGDRRVKSNPEGSPGYKVRVLRLFGDPHSPSETETVSEDYYPPLPRLIGTSPPKKNDPPLEAGFAALPDGQWYIAPDE